MLTEDLTVAAIDVDTSIAGMDALVDQELPGWCTFTLLHSTSAKSGFDGTFVGVPLRSVSLLVPGLMALFLHNLPAVLSALAVHTGVRSALGAVSVHRRPHAHLCMV